jgi:ubiquinone/menaquinone biosynthesis C-methylase UbiE
MAEKSMERIIPDLLTEGDVTGTETLRLHLERYEFAVKNIKGLRILDIACGVGYGSYLLKKKSTIPETQIIGVDNDAFAINYARVNYSLPGVTFIQSDAYQYDDKEGFDAVVSLETIEHMPDVDKFISTISPMLRVGGRWINSVPVTPTMDAIPFHLHDFTQKSFCNLFNSAGYKEVDRMLQIQPYGVVGVLTRKESRMENLRKNLLLYYAEHPRSLFKRLFSTLINGFNNHYLTVVWEKTTP